MAAAPVHVELFRFFGRHLWFTDTLFKALPYAGFVTLIYVTNHPSTSFWLGTEIRWPLVLVCELLVILPITVRRMLPAVSTALTALGALLLVVTGAGPGMSVFAVPLAVYSIARYGSRRASRFFLVVGLLGAALLGVTVLAASFFQLYPEYAHSLPRQPTSQLLTAAGFQTAFGAVVVVAAWLFGDLAGRRQREQEAIAERNRLLERERDHEARLAADAERMRIAREMHDVISHSMSVMVAQADGGRYVLSQDPEQAGRAFETISSTGRESLAELRRMLGVLREEGEQVQKRPAPGLTDLPQLIQDVRVSGLQVESHIETAQAPGVPVPEGVGLAVYRIVQEALTNTLKHAGPAAKVTVRVGITLAETGEPRLIAEVKDTGLGTHAEGDGAGSGLRGMQERAELYGGTVEFDAGPGGFNVAAGFPLAAEPDRAVQRTAQALEPGSVSNTPRTGLGHQETDPAASAVRRTAESEEV